MGEGEGKPLPLRLVRAGKLFAKGRNNDEIARRWT